jgi:hypothetical protein
MSNLPLIQFAFVKKFMEILPPPSGNGSSLKSRIQWVKRIVLRFTVKVKQDRFLEVRSSVGISIFFIITGVETQKNDLCSLRISDERFRN